MNSLNYYSLSKPKLRNFNAVLCSSSNYNFRHKRRSQTEILNATEIEEVIAKRMSKPTLMSAMFDQSKTNSINPKPQERNIKVGVLYDKTLKIANQSKKLHFISTTKAGAGKMKIVRGVNTHASFSYKENAPIIRGIRGARAKMHAIYNDCLRDQRSIHTILQTRNISNDFDFSINEGNRKSSLLPNTSMYCRKECITYSTSSIIKDSKTPKMIGKICIRCPAPKMLL